MWILFSACEVIAILSSIRILTHAAETKWPPFCRHFQMQFLEWKLVYFDLNCIKVWRLGINWQWISIGLCDGCVPTRPQTINDLNQLSNSFKWLLSPALPVKLPWVERSSLMISQHWSGYSLVPILVDKPLLTLGTLMTSAAADVINHNGRKVGRFKPRRFW